MSSDRLWDVVIYELATRKVDAVIGKGLRRFDGRGNGRNTAEIRQQSGREKINDRYDVEIVEAGKFTVGEALP